MKVTVNVRLTTGYTTGIAHYIHGLYANWPSKKELVFLRPKTTRPEGFVKAFWFDNFIAGFLAHGDVFHGPANILPIFKKRGIKYVVTIHDLAFLTVPQSCRFIFRQYYRWVVRRSVNQADLIIAVSRNTKKDLQRFYEVPTRKIKIIYSGVDEVFFSWQKKAPVMSGKYIFSVTTHAKRKNLSLIFRLLAEEPLLEDSKFVICGPVSDIAIPGQLKDRVIITGFVDKERLINLYQHAQFFIYPSYYEGFGFPVLEAMACRCLALVSNNSSLKEVVPDSRWRFDPDNLSQAADRIRNLLSLTPRQKADILERNYRWAKQFRWRETVEKTQAAFQKISQ